MSTVKFSTWVDTELAATTTVSSGDQLPVVRSSTPYSITRANLMKVPLTSVTASTYTVLADDEVIELDDSSNAITVTLPDRAANAGRYIIIRLIDGTNGATINRAGTDVITRASLTSVTLTSDGDFWVFFAGSTRWELTDGVESGLTWKKNYAGDAYCFERKIGGASGDLTFTFPFTFTSDNDISIYVSCFSSSNNRIGHSRSPSTTAVDYAVFVADTGSRVDVGVYVKATGRWYT